MVYDLIITEKAEELLDKLVYYLIYRLKNEQAAIHLFENVEKIYERLKENPYQFPESRDTNLKCQGYREAVLESMPAFKYAKKQLCDIAGEFEKRNSIPQIKSKLSIIKEINSDSYWDANDGMLFEKTRCELRDLMKFLVDG